MPTAGTYVLVLMAASLTCEADAQVVYRLAGSNIAAEGRLEVLYNDTWGTVCDDKFRNIEATVACISLGYWVGGEVIKTQYGRGEGQIWLDEVQCNGRETNLADCSHTLWGEHDCVHDEDVSIRCWGGAQVAYSMDGSQGTTSLGGGRLEVLYNGTWGTVCKDLFDSEEANVACFSLGFPNGGTTNFYGQPGAGKIWLDDVQCIGNERSIAECTHLPWGSHNCSHDRDVTVICTIDNPDGWTVSESNIPMEGRLYAKHNDFWGTVCNDGFTDVEARVACVSLGYTGGGEFIYNLYGPGVESGIIWLDDVKCKGTEKNLSECSHRPWGEHDCQHSDDVSIRCWAAAQILYRLNGSTIEGEGRLEIQYSGKWGTVCDHGFTNLTASTACHSLGYLAGGQFIGNMYGPGEGEIWLDDVQCNGGERTIADCPHGVWAAHDCDHSEDVSIRCELVEPIVYRLTGSNITTEGRLEVRYNNTWGTVCDDSFSNVEANIACGSLGFSNGGDFIYNLYGPGVGPIWLDDVKCNGTEKSIADCPHSPWGTTNCGHNEDVSIRCYPGNSYRLAGSNITGEGRLEVQHNNIWGTVCDDSFSNVEANIACGSLGYSSGGVFIYNQYGPGQDPIWLDEVKCNGNEQSIADCTHQPWGEHNCLHSEDVSIRCVTGPSILYRLAGSSITGEGRLEVQYNNTWGTVCDDSFSNVEASIACGSLGYSVGGEFIFSLYGPGVDPIWLDDVKCRGTEHSIDECPHSPWGTTNCGHNEDVSIRCWTSAQIVYSLAGSQVKGEGRLEVKYNDTWGTVCDNSFSNVEASIACGSLGYSDGGEFISNLYGPGKGKIWLNDVKCNGNERSIGDCSHLPWGSHSCVHDEDVSIRCH